MIDEVIKLYDGDKLDLNLIMYFNMLPALIEDEDLVFEELVNDMDKPCQANKIVNFTTQSKTDLTNLITGIFFGNNDFNLVFSDIDFPDDSDGVAITIPPVESVLNSDSENAIKIAFDNSYLEKATNLSIAMTTAHEFIHAYLIYLYIEGELLTFNANYTELNNAFATYYNDRNVVNTDALSDAMHDVYDDFLDMITDSVFAYATNNNISGATEDYCRKLVLGAHQDTDAFQELTPLKQTEYSTITVNENKGNENAKGSPCE